MRVTLAALRRYALSAADGPFGSGLKSDHYSDTGARVIRLGNIGRAEWRDADEAFIPLSYWTGLARHHARAGDLIVAGLGDEGHPVGRSCVLPDVGPALVKADCFRVTIDPNRADPRFLAWYLSSTRGLAESAMRSEGSTRPRLTLGKALGLPVPDLPVSSQRAIADYLDAETARIDALITKKRRLIDLADERLGVLIREAITSTDATWLPIKRRWRVIDCKHRTPEYVDEGYPVVSPGDATPGRLSLGCSHRFVTAADLADLAEGVRKPKRGDIIYTRNASIGIASYVDTDAPFCMGQDVCLITSATEDQLFLTYALNTFGLDQLEESKIGSTFSRINVDRVVELRVPCPEPAQQREIASACDEASDQRDRLVASLTRQIDLLVEHRQALITAAVTGELDLRESA